MHSDNSFSGMWQKEWQQYLEIFLKLIDAGETEKPENKQIWEMIDEELPEIYWQGRNPSDVLSIIQSRVQLYLMEDE